jgi:hypothetical protein
MSLDWQQLRDDGRLLAGVVPEDASVRDEHFGEPGHGADAAAADGECGGTERHAGRRAHRCCRPRCTPPRSSAQRQALPQVKTYAPLIKKRPNSK